MECIKCGKEMKYGCFPNYPIGDLGICGECFHTKPKTKKCWNCGADVFVYKCSICGEDFYWCPKCECGVEHLHTKKEREKKYEK